MLKWLQLREKCWHLSDFALHLNSQLKEIFIEVDAGHGILYSSLKLEKKLCVTRSLLEETIYLQTEIAKHHQLLVGNDGISLKYHVWCSRHNSVFNLGGDLEYFIHLIKQQDIKGLKQYGHECIEAVYNNATAYTLPVQTIALVQGDALGGGFEFVLSCNYVIAEKRSRFGLPETLFNLFPGMGAYTFLEQKLGVLGAEEFILSGKVISAEELESYGLVDMVAENSTGKDAVLALVRKLDKQYCTRQSLFKIRNRTKPIEKQVLLDIVDLWAETALTLSELDLKKMETLIKKQAKRSQVKLS